MLYYVLVYECVLVQMLNARSGVLSLIKYFKEKINIEIKYRFLTVNYSHTFTHFTLIITLKTIGKTTHYPLHQADPLM